MPFVAAGTTPPSGYSRLSTVSPLEELFQVGIVEEAVGIASPSVVAEGFRRSPRRARSCDKRLCGQSRVAIGSHPGALPRGKTPATCCPTLLQQYRDDIEVVGDVLDDLTRFGMEVNGVLSRIQWRDRDI